MRVVSVLLSVLLLLGLTHVLATEVDVESESSVQLPGFREPIAAQLRYFAQASYCSIDSVTKWACPVCAQGSLTNFKLTHKFFDAHTNTFGFAGLAPAAGENIIVFSFRGATPSAGRNWITDLNAQRMPYPGLRGATVHKGFYNAYVSIARQINLAAKSLLANCKNCHVYITGHSLGGAIATLAAADLYSLTPDLTLYTFGSPRVGDLNFATYMDKIVPDSFRLVHNQDLVPHIPQRFLGFRHVSREIWYYNSVGGQYKQCSGGEDDSCSNSVNLHVDENSIRDHATYLDLPMGCRMADLNRMGLISMIEEQVQVQSSHPIDKLKAKYTDNDVLLEVEAQAMTETDAEAETEAETETEAESESAAEPAAKADAESEDDVDAGEVLSAAARARAERLKLSGGVEVFPARVLDPLSRPGIRQMENRLAAVQHQWTKFPFSWNPKVVEENAEAKWNRKYPHPDVVEAREKAEKLKRKKMIARAKAEAAAQAKAEAAVAEKLSRV